MPAELKRKQFIALRQSLGLSQADMGKLLGLSQSQVSRIEDGKRRITPMLQKLLETIPRQ